MTATPKEDESNWLVYLAGIAFFGTLLYIGFGLARLIGPVVIELIVMLFRSILRL